MNILVTGAAGWMGGGIVELLSAAGHSIIAAARRADAFAKRGLAEGNGVRFAAFDLTSAWPDLGYCDVIVHLGAQSRPSGPSSTDYVHKNVWAMERLVEYARRARPKLVIFASSISVFGRIKSPAVDEATPTIDPLPYGMTKRLGEILLAENADWLNSVSLRLPGVLGPGASTPWLASVLRRARANEAIPVYNPDGWFNNCVHIADLANLMLRLMESPPEGADMIVLGADGKMTIRDTVVALKESCGSSSPVEAVAARQNWFLIDSGRARRRYGYAPMNVADMIRRFAGEQ